MQLRCTGRTVTRKGLLLGEECGATALMSADAARAAGWRVAPGGAPAMCPGCATPGPASAEDPPATGSEQMSLDFPG